VEQHLELDETLSLKAAHDVVTAIEQQIKSDVPEISSILTHIESEPATIETGDELAAGEEMLPRLRKIASDFPDVVDVHEVVVRKFNDRLYLSCHITMADDLPLHKVHELSTALEIRFKQEIPELFKVLIHPEPKTDNRR
jgi:divalent metal cation (Fe/Co/Zn/Cd) transporter